MKCIIRRQETKDHVLARSALNKLCQLHEEMRKLSERHSLDGYSYFDADSRDIGLLVTYRATSDWTIEAITGTTLSKLASGATATGNAGVAYAPMHVGTVVGEGNVEKYRGPVVGSRYSRIAFRSMGTRVV